TGWIGPLLVERNGELAEKSHHLRGDDRGWREDGGRGHRRALLPTPNSKSSLAMALASEAESAPATASPGPGRSSHCEGGSYHPNGWTSVSRRQPRGSRFRRPDSAGLGHPPGLECRTAEAKTPNASWRSTPGCPTRRAPAWG